MTINPYDVFPKRNLPDEAEPWGRKSEERIVALEHDAIAQSTGLASEGRTAASSLGQLTQQLNEQERQAELLSDLFLAIPKTYQSIGQANSFALASGWKTVCEVEVTVPPGATRAAIMAAASGQLATAVTGRLVTSKHRLSIEGVSSSPEFPGLWVSVPGGFHTSMAPSFGWSIGVSGGQTLRIRLDVAPDDGAAYPANGATYAVLTSISTFTG